MIPDDTSLALAAAGGDGQAFALLLDRHYDRIFAFCFRLTGARADAEDLTQDICAALPAKLATFQGKSKVTTWLYKVAMNAAHDRRRRQATHTRHATGWGDWEIARQDQITEDRAALDWLTRAMTALSPELRDTLALVLDDVTHADAAQILGISEGTVSWRISEAKKKLRTLKETEDAE